MHVQASLQALRVAVPYIRAYRGRVFVIKLGGRLCQPGRVLDHLVNQLALLHRVGIRLVVVHGGGAQATALGQQLGVQPNFFAGRRITDAATLEVVKMALAGTVNTDLLAAFRRVQVPAVGVSGVDAGLLAACPRPPQTISDPTTHETRLVDFGHVGDIVDVCPDLLRHLLAADYVPVVCPLAADGTGQLLNINADTVAAQLAVALGAAKYLLVTSVDGVLRDRNDPATLQSYLSLTQLDELIRMGAVGGGMLPKLAACRAALCGGVPRVHIVNGLEPDTILGEIFTNEGCGTLLVAGDPSGAPAAETAAAVP